MPDGVGGASPGTALQDALGVVEAGRGFLDRLAPAAWALTASALGLGLLVGAGAGLLFGGSGDTSAAVSHLEVARSGTASSVTPAPNGASGTAAASPATGASPTASATPTLTAKPINALFSQQIFTTDYTVEVAPANAQVTYEWSGADCGTFGTVPGRPSAFRWSHPHPPCDPTTDHADRTIVVRITGLEQQVQCSYRGASTGTGGACTTTAAPGGKVVAGGPVMAPSVGKVVVKGGISGTTAGGMAAGGAALTLTGVAIMIRRRCDCRQLEANAQSIAHMIAHTEAEIADLKEFRPKLAAAITSWEDGLIDIYFAEWDLQNFIDAVPDALVKWQAYIVAMQGYVVALQHRLAFLKSLLGPLAIAGRDHYSTTPKDGWIQIGPNLYASSEEAADEARTAVAIADALSGGLMSTETGGLRYVGAIEATEMSITQAQAKIAAAQKSMQDINTQLWGAQIDLLIMELIDEPDCIKHITEYNAKLKGVDSTIELREKLELPQQKANYVAAIAKLNACLAVVVPPGPCPPDVAVIEEYDIAEYDDVIETPPVRDGVQRDPPSGPTTEQDGLGGILEGFAGIGGGTITSTPAPPTEAPPTVPSNPSMGAAPPTKERKPGDAVALLSTDQKHEIGTQVKEREDIRTQIKDLEAKPTLTEAEKRTLDDLRGKERDLNTKISNTIARAHNENVELLHQERIRRDTKQTVTVDPKDAERIDELTKQRNALDAEVKTLEVKEHDGTLTDAERNTLTTRRNELSTADDRLREAKAEAIKNAKVTTTKPVEISTEDAEKIRKIQDERATIQRDITELETKEKAGTITDAERGRLSVRRQDLADIPGRVNTEYTRALKDAEAREAERLKTAGTTSPATPQATPAAPSANGTKAAPTKLLPEDQQAIEEKERRIREIQRELFPLEERDATGALTFRRDQLDVQIRGLREASRTRSLTDPELATLSDLERERGTIDTQIKTLTANPLTVEQRDRLTTLRKEYAALLDDVVTTYKAAEARAASAPPPTKPRDPQPADAVVVRATVIERIATLSKDPDKLTPAEWHELSALRERLRALDEEISRLCDQATGRPHLSPAAESAAREAGTKIDTLRREASTLAERVRTLEAQPTRTPAEDAEISLAKQRLLTEIAGELQTIARDLFTKFPELVELFREPPATGGAPASGAAAPPTDTRDPMEVLKAQSDARTESVRKIATDWVRDHLHITDPKHPLVDALTGIGVGLGEDVLVGLLQAVHATDARSVLAEVVLGAGERIPPAQTLPLLVNISALLASTQVDVVRQWGAVPDATRLRQRIAERIADIALIDGTLNGLLTGVSALREAGLTQSPKMQALATKVREVFPTQFDVRALINGILATHESSVTEAAQLTSIISGLRRLLDTIGDDTHIRAALDELVRFGTQLARQIEQDILRMTREAEEAGRAEEAAKRLFERVRDQGLKDMTPEDERIFDAVYDEWRIWRNHGSIMQRTGEYSARHLEPGLEERWHRLSGKTRRIAQEVGALEQARLVLTTSHLSEAERATVLGTTYRAHQAEELRFYNSINGSGITGDTLGLLTVMRAKAESAQALSLGGNSTAIREELEAIFKELNGWDEMYDRPGYILQGRTHHEGLRERLMKIDPDREAVDSAVTRGPDASPEKREAWLIRDRIAYLQQRRIDLMLAGQGSFSYGSLREELRRDVLFWEHQKPWKEVAWASGDNWSESIYQETSATLLGELPYLAWQMASAQHDPQQFAAFLRQLQNEKIARGEAAWTAYQDTPWWRRGPINQTARLLNATKVAEKMYERDVRLHTALAAMASTAIERLPNEVKEVLLAHGFIEKDEQGREKYVVPRAFQWNPFSVGEEESQRDWTDEFFNLTNVAQTAATFYIGGMAGSAARSLALSEEAYGVWLALASKTAIEATAFMAMNSAVRGGNPFAVLLGTANYKDLALEWLETALMIGGLSAMGPALEAMERAALAESKLVGRYARNFEAAGSRTALETFFAKSAVAGARTAFDAVYMSTLGAGFNYVRSGSFTLTPEDLLRSFFTVGVMRTQGWISEARARDLNRQAREYGRLIVLAQEAYTRVLREVLGDARAAHERAVSEGRATPDSPIRLNDHERARLANAKQGYIDATGKLDITRELRGLERDISRELGVEIGSASGGWRDLVTSEARQRDAFGGRTLLEALNTLDGAATDPFPVRFKTAFQAAVRLMYQAGSWVGTKQEMYRNHPEIADALFRVRKAWADWITNNPTNRATVIGTVKDMRNDCDFNFALGEGATLDPVPRLRGVAEETQRMVREALEGTGLTPEQLRAVDYQVILESNSYTDPAILHLYTRLPEALRGDVIRALTRDSVGVVRWMIEHHFEALPPAVRSRAVRDLTLYATDGVRTPDQLASDLGISHWHSPEGRTRLLELQSQLFERFRTNPNDALVVQQICETQMLLNVMAEGAYVTPGAGLVTVSIKEGVLSPEMQQTRRQLKGVQNEVAELERQREAIEGTEERKRVEKELAPLREEMTRLVGRDLSIEIPRRVELGREIAALEAQLRTLAAKQPTAESRALGERITERRAAADAIERNYDAQRLDMIRRLTPDEALQSVLGDLVFFWHIAESASKNLEGFDIVMRYEFSKYVARLLEVARVFGMDPNSGVAGDFRYLGIAKLLKIATRIYKGKDPGRVFGEGPAFESLTEMREYFDAVQRASGEVMRFLIEASHFGETPGTGTRPTDRPGTPPAEQPWSWPIGWDVTPEASARGRRGTAVAEPAPRNPIELWMTERFEPGWDEWATDAPSRGPGSGSAATERANEAFVNLTTAERELRHILGGDEAYTGREHAAVDHFYRQYVESLEAVRAASEAEGPNYWEHFEYAREVEFLRRNLARTMPPVEQFHAAVDELVAPTETAYAAEEAEVLARVQRTMDELAARPPGSMTHEEWVARVLADFMPGGANNPTPPRPPSPPIYALDLAGQQVTIDLAAHEGQGLGHAMERHVGQTDEMLLDRLFREALVRERRITQLRLQLEPLLLAEAAQKWPNDTVEQRRALVEQTLDSFRPTQNSWLDADAQASTFPDLPTANRAVNDALQFFNWRVLDWLTDPHGNPNERLALQFKCSFTTGRSAARGFEELSLNNIADTDWVTVVLAHNPSRPEFFHVLTAFPGP